MADTFSKIMNVALSNDDQFVPFPALCVSSSSRKVLTLRPPVPEIITFMDDLHTEIDIQRGNLIFNNFKLYLMFFLPFCPNGEGVGAAEVMGSKREKRRMGNHLQTIISGLFKHFY